MAELFFCYVDVKYLEEDTYAPRHAKAILRVADFNEAFEEMNRWVSNIEEISFKWAGGDSKQELFFTESEFDRFEFITHCIEDDKSYEDYLEAEERYERSKQN